MLLGVADRRIVRLRGRGHGLKDIEALPVNELSGSRHFGSMANSGDETPDG